MKHSFPSTTALKLFTNVEGIAAKDVEVKKTAWAMLYDYDDTLEKLEDLPENIEEAIQHVLVENGERVPEGGVARGTAFRYGLKIRQQADAYLALSNNHRDIYQKDIHATARLLWEYMIEYHTKKYAGVVKTVRKATSKA